MNDILNSERRIKNSEVSLVIGSQNLPFGMQNVIFLERLELLLIDNQFRLFGRFGNQSASISEPVCSVYVPSTVKRDGYVFLKFGDIQASNNGIVRTEDSVLIDEFKAFEEELLPMNKSFEEAFKVLEKSFSLTKILEEYSFILEHAHKYSRDSDLFKAYNILKQRAEGRFLPAYNRWVKEGKIVPAKYSNYYLDGFRQNVEKLNGYLSNFPFINNE